MILTLDENEHTYFRDGQRVPISVTGLLKWTGLVDDTWFSKYGRIRGQLTHRAIQWYNEGVLDEDALDEILQPYLAAYIRFLTDSGFRVSDSEVSLYSARWDVAGTLDFIGRFPKNAVIDYIGDAKTGAVQPWTEIQIALYRVLLGKRCRGFALELRRNERYRVHWYEDTTKADAQALEMLKEWKEKNNAA